MTQTHNQSKAEAAPFTPTYLTYNTGNFQQATWVHIASGKPFTLKPGRYGRFSTTLCGKEYEMDSQTPVATERIGHRLCKSCARSLAAHKRKENQS